METEYSLSCTEVSTSEAFLDPHTYIQYKYPHFIYLSFLYYFPIHLVS
jgi:hypothetical protein